MSPTTNHTIEISSIRVDGGTQARVQLNDDTIAEYTEAVKAGDALPAVVVFNDGTDNWLADGFHRYHAHVAAGVTSIEADVRTGTQRDAIIFSLGANHTHGLRRTNADKHKSVTTMFADQEWSTWSDNAIALCCGVSNRFVAKARAVTMNIHSEKPEEREYITKHGTKAKMKVRKIGPGTTAEPKPPKEPKGKAPADGTPPAEPGANVSTPMSPEGPSEEDKIAEEAHGDTDLAQLVDEQVKEIEALQAQVTAAMADDLKAEALKFQRIASVANTRQNELMTRVNEREAELKRYVNALRRLGKLVGEDDPWKILTAVEKVVRASLAEAVVITREDDQYLTIPNTQVPRALEPWAHAETGGIEQDDDAKLFA